LDQLKRKKSVDERIAIINGMQRTGKINEPLATALYNEILDDYLEDDS